MKELMRNLPNHTYQSIKDRGGKHFHLTSYKKLQELWKEDEMEFIRDNWQIMSDYELSQHVAHTRAATKVKREKMGLYRQDMESNSYPSLSKFLRGQNQQWKNDSMKQCDWQCVLTNSKDFDIHHLYGVSNIVSDILNEYPEYKDRPYSDYTDEELSFLVQKFIDEQSKYPLGECVRSDLHKLFHSLYGQYYNTPEQWYHFKKEYLKGTYDELLKEAS